MKIPLSSTLFSVAQSLLDKKTDVFFVKIEKAKGSTPRDAGTGMLVTNASTHGTIGGGQLEWIATKQARELISSGKEQLEHTIPLGPEIGQCCGGSVVLSYRKLTVNNARKILMREPDNKPSVQIHGAGHTGTALVKALALLPFEITLIDSREDALSKLPDDINKIQSVLPEEIVREAKAETAYVIFTHEHHLDFLIAAEALKRKDAAYVGMIGSKTKRAVFKNWLVEHDYGPALEADLTCPIGASTAKDKRPEIIAVLVAAELIGIFAK